MYHEHLLVLDYMKKLLYHPIRNDTNGRRTMHTPGSFISNGFKGEGQRGRAPYLALITRFSPKSPQSPAARPSTRSQVYLAFVAHACVVRDDLQDDKLRQGDQAAVSYGEARGGAEVGSNTDKLERELELFWNLGKKGLERAGFLRRACPGLQLAYLDEEPALGYRRRSGAVLGKPFLVTQVGRPESHGCFPPRAGNVFKAQRSLDEDIFAVMNAFGSMGSVEYTARDRCTKGLGVGVGTILSSQTNTRTYGRYVSHPAWTTSPSLPIR
ncbi:hypothetical protein BOTBODRAFT_47429 [Botryobasidium botryosum FD-172 SS1]|uniref:Uncharacterized protein n=1 Tax=Botryobasidium botryosum (strain FD-172 SS1) TaxID=930990 RepID=A0A067M589_BOTB1|nr:hypothetical protein BOTBODRAFT_47429 [Botryobasidium botryosum FD-172 SS1]